MAVALRCRCGLACGYTGECADGVGCKAEKVYASSTDRKRAWRQAKRMEHESRIDLFVDRVSRSGWQLKARHRNRGTTIRLLLERQGVFRTIDTPRGWTP